MIDLDRLKSRLGAGNVFDDEWSKEKDVTVCAVGTYE
jgi:hypothetical protein